MWVVWLSHEVKIQDDGLVGVYIDFYVPGWLLLQIGRTLWPHINDVRTDGRRTSISVLNILRGRPNNGYMVDRMSFISWLHITNYDGSKCLANFEWVLVDSEREKEKGADDKMYQILTAGQVCLGMQRQAMELCWVEIPDLNLPVPLREFLEL